MTVFVLMARKASMLTRRPSIEGWLQSAAHNVARSMRRSEEARRRRERKVAVDTYCCAEWRLPETRVMICEALKALSPRDSEALMLRY